MQFYRQNNAYVGDCIPFYWQGKYHLFYLVTIHDFLPGGQLSWAHAVSEDLRNWDEMPVAIPLGKGNEPDSACCGTGCAVEFNGTFHIFYLGLWIRDNNVDDQRQTICHARSTDLIHWEKDINNPILVPDRDKYSVDWRDPHVIWDAEKEEFLMLITSKCAKGPVGHEGCIALMASKDLEKWETREPLFAPFQYNCMECPDLFHINGWWYLVFSVFPPTFKTMYRRSRSLNGPWISDREFAMDDCNFYAGKTAGDGKRQFMFGWVFYKSENKDNGVLQWGGNLSVRELVQNENGSLSVKLPEERMEKGLMINESDCSILTGKWSLKNGKAENEWAEGFSCMTVNNIKPDSQIVLKFTPSKNTHTVGVFLRTEKDLSAGYCLRLELITGRAVLASVDGGQLYNTLTQPIPEIEGEIDCVITMEDSVIEAFIGGQVCLTGRFFEHKGTTLGMFVEEGGCIFENLSIASL